MFLASAYSLLSFMQLGRVVRQSTLKSAPANPLFCLQILATCLQAVLSRHKGGEWLLDTISGYPGLNRVFHRPAGCSGFPIPLFLIGTCEAFHFCTILVVCVAPPYEDSYCLSGFIFAQCALMEVGGIEPPLHRTNGA